MKKCANRFTEKFADIQKQFDKVFRELFGGGKGTLELVEEEDVLEAGITINAQPAGKETWQHDAVVRWREGVNSHCTFVCYSKFETFSVLSA